MALWYRGELEEVASDNELNTSKCTAVIPNSSSNFLEFVKQVSINH
jgi:hypothetical protein